LQVEGANLKEQPLFSMQTLRHSNARLRARTQGGAVQKKTKPKDPSVRRCGTPEIDIPKGKRDGRKITGINASSEKTARKWGLKAIRRKAAKESSSGEGGSRGPKWGGGGKKKVGAWVARSSVEWCRTRNERRRKLVKKL